MEGMRLIHSGEDWPHARPPCAKDMAGFLEHNEKIVSWVQPVRPFARCPVRSRIVPTLTRAGAGGGDHRGPDPRRPVPRGLLPAEPAHDEVRVAAHTPQEGLREPGGRALRGVQAAYPSAALPREETHASTVQCEPSRAAGHVPFARSIKSETRAGHADGLVVGGRPQGPQASAERLQQDLVRRAPRADPAARRAHPAPRVLPSGARPSHVSFCPVRARPVRPTARPRV